MLKEKDSIIESIILFHEISKILLIEKKTQKKKKKKSKT